MVLIFDGESIINEYNLTIPFLRVDSCDYLATVVLEFVKRTINDKAADKVAFVYGSVSKDKYLKEFNDQIENLLLRLKENKIFVLSDNVKSTFELIAGVINSIGKKDYVVVSDCKLVNDLFNNDETFVSQNKLVDLHCLLGINKEKILGINYAKKLISEFDSITDLLSNSEKILPINARNIVLNKKDIIRENYDYLCNGLSTVMDIDESQLAFDGIIDVNDSFNEGICDASDKGISQNVSVIKELQVSEVIDNVSIIDDFNQAMQYFDKLKSQETEVFSYEIIGDSDNGSIESIAFCTDGDNVTFIQCANFISSDLVKNNWHELNSSDKQCITMDIKKNLAYLDSCNMTNSFDVSLAAYLLNPLRESYDAIDIMNEYLNMNIKSIDESLSMDKKMELSLKGIDELTVNTALKCLVSYSSYEVLRKRLESEDMIKLYYDIELPLVSVLYDMQKFGMKVDKDGLKAYGENLLSGIKELEKEIFAKAGVEFNINSPKQLGEILFERLNLEGAKKTKTGYQTSADVLMKIKDQHPIIEDILEYRQLTKLYSTYAQGLFECIGNDGRIHSKFNQTITATGRISSTEPNLQNIPIRMELGRQIRKVFVPEEGYVFVDADYSQIELRILAHMSKDESLIDAYCKSVDIHTLTASQVFHVGLDEVTPLQRRNAKAVNFGIVYGISSFGLSQDLSITRKEAAKYIEDYFESYPGIKSYLDGLVNQGKTLGYVTTMYGRKRPIPEINSNNFNQRSFGERIAMNSPIQGSAADIIKLAMIRVSNRLKEEKLKSRLILQVHDELLIECYEPELNKVQEIIKNEMENVCKLSVPLEIDMHTGKDWYEAK